jgi:uncharacterized membrane protein YphA (DoxX/SURF4 family)
MKMNDKSRRILLLAGRLALAFVFLYSSYAKMKPQGGGEWSVQSVKVSLALFAFQVDTYHIFPHPAAVIFARVLPPAELVLGVWLLTGFGLRFSAACSGLLMAVFILAMLWAYLHGVRGDCGCGLNRQIGLRSFLEDGLLFAVSFAVAFAASKRSPFHDLN